MKHPKTLGALKKSGYQPLSVKQELRKNLRLRLENGQSPFPGIYGYENTVIPQVERAILAGHNINFLGLRGQAKTKMARLMTDLLDEYIPIIAGSDLQEDPLRPITRWAREFIEEAGNDLPIAWVHRTERYTEKLATPDVSVADLIGDVDPIKASNLKLSFSNPEVIHFGLIPRANRGIFVINELPDLQARIQVALLNILQEGDIQIRGFKLRLPLDIAFVFTANPEDYTHRGSIITPLKDRIESQILTHYPESITDSRKITDAESRISPEVKEKVNMPDLICDLIEQVALEGRKSEYVDAKSGVSARLTITARELALSSAEWRMIHTGEENTMVRVTDLAGIVPAINGKVELVYEGDREGPSKVAQHLIGKAIKTRFIQYFPSPERIKRKKEDNPYRVIAGWFEEGNRLELPLLLSTSEFAAALKQVSGLESCVEKYHPGADKAQKQMLAEFLLYGLSEYQVISRFDADDGMLFSDILGSILGEDDTEEN
jgi:magnesium chelatase subunit I